MDAGLLKKVLVDLHATSYQKQTLCEFAPQKTDCLTSVHYIYKNAFDLLFPVTWIGDMPNLLLQRGWSALVQDVKNLQMGDLLFLKRRGMARPIVHVALALSERAVFHCTKERGALIESIDQLFQSFEQVQLDQQLCYIDSRNKEMRKKAGGIYRAPVFIKQGFVAFLVQNKLTWQTPS